MPFSKIKMRQKLTAAFVAFLIIVAFASLLRGGETQVITASPGMIELRLQNFTPSADTVVAWEARQPLDLQTLGPYEGGAVFIVNAVKPGQYIVSSDLVDFANRRFDKTRYIINVQGPQPPPDVVPPTPDVTPTPTDVVTPAPIPMPGLRVLIVYESLDAPPKVPKPQYDAMFDGNVRDWMTSNCAVGPTNTAEWRMIDDDDLFVGEEQPHWKAASMRPRRNLPWVIISNGTTNRGYEGPVPADSDKFLELLKRFK